MDVPILAGVTTQDHLTDGDYLLVAAVAEREGWEDLARPVTTAESPRTLAEHAAVLRYAAAVPRPRLATGWDPRWARIVMLALGAVGLLVCWLISPERTALGLLMVGVFCLLGLRRRATAGTRVPVPAMGRRTLRPF